VGGGRTRMGDSHTSSIGGGQSRQQSLQGSAKRLACAMRIAVVSEDGAEQLREGWAPAWRVQRATHWELGWRRARGLGREGAPSRCPPRPCPGAPWARA
jgi:hypothetical protein